MNTALVWTSSREADDHRWWCIVTVPNRRTLLALLSVSVLPALTMCSGPDDDPTLPSPVETPGQQQTQLEAETRKLVEGMPDGPEGPNHPLWYEPLRDMNCTDEHLVASRGQAIPMAGYLLCEAATSDDDGLWAQGEEALAQAPPPKSCWEQEAVAAMQRLVDARREDPGATFTFDEQSGVACPLVLEGIGTPAAPGVVAAEIPVSMCGGAPVFLHGNIEYLNEGTVRAVSVGDTPVPVKSGNGGLFFRAPASDVPGTQPVTVTDAEWPVEGVTRLVYEQPPMACPSVPPPIRPATSSASPVEEGP